LEGMIPCYINVGNKIEDLGEDENGDSHGKLHLFFLDDNSFGSSVLGHGLENGGMLKYAALDIVFPNSSTSDNHQIEKNDFLLINNYPNPFKNSTNIYFEISKQRQKDSKLEIFNIKGQCVKEFSLSQNQNSVIWDAKDNHGKNLGSGIYFAKIQNGKTDYIHKMIFLK